MNIHCSYCNSPAHVKAYCPYVELDENLSLTEVVASINEIEEG